MKPRYYTIKPKYDARPNGELIHSGYAVTGSDGWQTTHGTICLCQSAVMQREQMISTAHRTPRVFNQDWFVSYEDCEPTDNITPARLAFYQLQ